MPIIFTALARVRDWQALQELHNNLIVDRIRTIKAIRYRIYRNPSDASQALLLIELADPDDAGDVRAILVELLNGLNKVKLTADWVWEPTDWEAIDGLEKGGSQTLHILE